MLVQSRKSKRSWYPPSKHSLKTIEGKLSKTSVVDRVYKEFYEKRRSQEVLKNIETVLEKEAAVTPPSVFHW